MRRWPCAHFPLETCPVRTWRRAHLAIHPDPGSPFGAVTLSTGGQILRARITRASREKLALTVGQDVQALVRSASLEGRV